MAPSNREHRKKSALTPQDITDKIGNWLHGSHWGTGQLGDWVPGSSTEGGGRHQSISRVPLIQPTLTNHRGLAIGPTGVASVDGREWISLLEPEKLLVLRKFSAAELLTLVANGSEVKKDIEVFEHRLAAEIKGNRHQVLEQSVSTFDYWNLSLLDALKHWLQHKGLWIINGEFRAYDFVRWYNGFQVFIECKAVEEYVQHLIHIHLQLHAIIFVMSADVDTLTQACNDLVLPERARAQRQNDNNNDITRIKQGLLQKLELHDVSEDKAWGHAGAVMPLTRTSWVDGRNVPGLPDYYKFLDDFELRPLRAVGFGGMSHNHVPRLAYCVRSHHYQEIVELINRALANETSPLEEALVLETLFIY